VGTGNAVGVVSREGGYYKIPKSRIPLPGAIQKMKKILGAAEYGKEIDNFDLSMDRAAGNYVDRPIITYSPILRNKFACSLMASIPPPSIQSLLQADYPADLVFRLTVNEVNGICNCFGGGARARSAAMEFYALIGKLRRIQAAGNMGMRITRKEKEKKKLP